MKTIDVHDKIIAQTHELEYPWNSFWLFTDWFREVDEMLKKITLNDYEMESNEIIKTTCVTDSESDNISKTTKLEMI